MLADNQSCLNNIKKIVFKSNLTYPLLGMLNDYRIFDYRIKCSFSFSFVSHSILEVLLENARSSQLSGGLSASIVLDSTNTSVGDMGI